MVGVDDTVILWHHLTLSLKLFPALHCYYPLRPPNRRKNLLDTVTLSLESGSCGGGEMGYETIQDKHSPKPSEMWGTRALGGTGMGWALPADGDSVGTSHLGWLGFRSGDFRFYFKTTTSVPEDTVERSGYKEASGA